MIFGSRRKHRFVLGFFMRPVLPFALEFLLLTPLVLGTDVPEVEPLYLFLAPWLLSVVGILNLPFLGQLFRLFKTDLSTRRNHSLEHATIHFLRAAGQTRLAGRASQNGFRVSGGSSPEQIRSAFEQVRWLVQAGKPLPHVSRYCGSNRITALALAMFLLLLVTAGTIVFRPPLWVRTSLLVGVLLLFTAMRHAIGNWVQARLFMATDFTAASVREIRKVKTELVENPPVYFVETLIQEA